MVKPWSIYLHKFILVACHIPLINSAAGNLHPLLIPAMKTLYAAPSWNMITFCYDENNVNETNTYSTSAAMITEKHGQKSHEHAVENWR